MSPLHYALAGQPLTLLTLAVAFPTLAEWSEATVREVAEAGRLDPEDRAAVRRLARRCGVDRTMLTVAIIEACRKEVGC